MEDILNKPHFDHVKDELNAINGNSDSDGGYDDMDDDSRELALAIEENISRQDSYSSMNIKPEMVGSFSMGMDTDIILPEASQNSASKQAAERRKKEAQVKSKRELEEEEREKMQ